MSSTTGPNLLANWHSILQDLQIEVGGDAFWETYLNHFSSADHVPFAVHLAIFVEPYLGYVLEGKKTVESRFSSNRCAPYKAVQKGDILLLKQSGGPIIGICQVGTTWFYELDPESWNEIKNVYAEALCAHDSAFWTSRERASFATLMQLQNIRRIEPKQIRKRDRRGWVVLQQPMELPYPVGGKV